jgi:hypothetical protein
MTDVIDITPFGALTYKEYDDKRHPKDFATVYELIDPRNDKFRYVGQTINPTERYHAHINCAVNGGGRKGDWLNEIIKANLLPRMIELEVVPVRDAKEAEIRWVKLRLREGFVLMNGEAKQFTGPREPLYVGRGAFRCPLCAGRRVMSVAGYSANPTCPSCAIMKLQPANQNAKRVAKAARAMSDIGD